MTTGLATSRTWRGGQVVDDEVALDEIEAAAKDPTSLVWVDLVAPSHELLGEIVGSLGLASTAVEDALATKAATAAQPAH